MNITLTKPAVVPSTTISQITLDHFEDYSEQQEVRAFISGYPGRNPNQWLVLWSKETKPSYTDAGQYTDDDIKARINELLS